MLKLTESTYLPKLRDGYSWRVWLNEKGTVELYVLRRNKHGVEFGKYLITEIYPESFWDEDEDVQIASIAKQLFLDANRTMEWSQWSPDAHRKWQKLADMLFEPKDDTDAETGNTVPTVPVR